LYKGSTSFTRSTISLSSISRNTINCGEEGAGLDGTKFSDLLPMCSPKFPLIFLPFLKPLCNMVRPAGFEPTASGLGILRSILLSYGRKVQMYFSNLMKFQKFARLLASLPGDLYSSDFKNSGRHPSGEPEERILIRGRG
jgi:hypothetical protein